MLKYQYAESNEDVSLFPIYVWRVVQTHSVEKIKTELSGTWQFQNPNLLSFGDDRKCV